MFLLEPLAIHFALIRVSQAQIREHCSIPAESNQYCDTLSRIPQDLLRLQTPECWNNSQSQYSTLIEHTGRERETEQERC